MIKRLLKNQIYVALWVPIFIVTQLMFQYLFMPKEGCVHESMNLWHFDFSTITYDYAIIITGVFVLLNAFLINYTFNHLEFYRKFIYLPSTLYVLILFSFNETIFFCEELVAQTFLILSLMQILTMHQNEDIRKQVFLSGLFIGIAASFVPFYGFFLVVVYVAFFALKPFQFREIMLPLVGCAIPLIWVLVLRLSSADELLKEMEIETDLLVLQTIDSFVLLFSLPVLGILTFVTLRRLFKVRVRNTVRFKRLSDIIVITFILSLMIGLLLTAEHKTFESLSIVAITLSFMVPYSFLERNKNWFASILFYCLIVINIGKFFLPISL